MQTAWREEIERHCAAFSGRCGLVVRHAQQGDLFQFQAQEAFAAASLIKLPILYYYGLLQEDGRVDPTLRLPLQAADKVPGSGILQDLSPGCLLTLNDLVTLMIILSDNTATNMLIDHWGIEPVNEMLDEIGLADTRLRRKMYDWQAQQQGRENVTTAQDMAALLLALWRGDRLSDSQRARLLAILQRQHYRGKLPALTPQPDQWAHKTGELDDADHDAGFLLLNESAVIVALLTSGGRGPRERVQLANQIGRLVYDRFAG